jgi:hypothetical protein
MLTNLSLSLSLSLSRLSPGFLQLNARSSFANLSRRYEYIFMALDSMKKRFSLKQGNRHAQHGTQDTDTTHNSEKDGIDISVGSQDLDSCPAVGVDLPPAPLQDIEPASQLCQGGHSTSSTVQDNTFHSSAPLNSESSTVRVTNDQVMDDATNFTPLHRFRWIARRVIRAAKFARYYEIGYAEILPHLNPYFLTFTEREVEYSFAAAHLCASQSTLA